MKKLLSAVCIVGLLLSFTSVFANQDEQKGKECTKECIRWEEKRDCRPDPVQPGKQICATYKVCVEYQEKCN